MRPIGFFDSGIGGLSIWKEVNTLLPNESTIYLADNKNVPYGKKSREEILYLTKKNTEFLLTKGCKLIVVACNTATTSAIDILRKDYDVPFIGIEPAIKPAGLVTKSRKIGILATEGTLNSGLFEQTSNSLDNDIEIIEQIGERLVDLIENNRIDSEEMNSLLRSYLTPMINKGIDALVLGCTHYPYLINSIRKITDNKINIIDSGEAVARQTKSILIKNNMASNSSERPFYQFYSNTNVDTLNCVLKEVKQRKVYYLNF